MKRNRLNLLFFLLFFYQSLIGQETIPFELTDKNNISIKTLLNNEDTVKLMFHTASNSVTLIRESTARLKSVNWNKEEEGIKSWGGENTSRISENNILQIGTMRWDSTLIWENEYSGPKTDGKFGPNLFQDKVIEVNFEESVLKIHEALPEEISSYEKLDVVYENGFMFIEGSSEIGATSYTNRFLIHTGYGGSILFDDEFVDNSKIGDHLEILEEQELKDSYGNVLKTKRAELPVFFLGKERLDNVPVGFFEGAIGRQKMSVLGGDVLKRFNIIIDSDRESIYLKRNKLINTPYTN